MLPLLPPDVPTLRWFRADIAVEYLAQQRIHQRHAVVAVAMIVLHKLDVAVAAASTDVVAGIAPDTLAESECEIVVVRCCSRHS